VRGELGDLPESTRLIEDRRGHLAVAHGDVPGRTGGPPDRVVVAFARAVLCVMIAGDVRSEAGSGDIATLDRARSTTGRAVVR
jgi:hypothetical protein